MVPTDLVKRSAPAARLRQGGDRLVVSDGLQIDRACLAVAAGFQLKGDFLPIPQRVQSGALNGRDMDKHIPASGLRLNEAISLVGVEPLDCPARHCPSPLHNKTLLGIALSRAARDF